MLSALISAFLLQSTPVEPSPWVKLPPSELRHVVGLRMVKRYGKRGLLETQPYENAKPYISKDGSRIYVSERSRRFRALDLATGELLWQLEGIGNVGPSMFEHDGLLWVGSGSDLLALDPFTGAQKKQIPLNAAVGNHPVVIGDRALIGLRPNAYALVDLKAGQELWRVKRSTPDALSVRGQAQPLLDPSGEKAYLGFSDGSLVAVSLKDGSYLWVVGLGQRRRFFPDVDASPIWVNGRIMVASYNGGLYWVNPENGRIDKRRDLEGLYSLLPTADGEIFAAFGDGRVAKLSAKGGLRWVYRLSRGYAGRLSELGEHLVFASSEGPITILSKKDGRPLQLLGSSFGFSSGVAVRGDDLAAMSNAGSLYILKKGATGGLSLSRHH